MTAYNISTRLDTLESKLSRCQQLVNMLAADDGGDGETPEPDPREAA